MPKSQFVLVSKNPQETRNSVTVGWLFRIHMTAQVGFPDSQAHSEVAWSDFLCVPQTAG